MSSATGCSSPPLNTEELQRARHAGLRGGFFKNNTRVALDIQSEELVLQFVLIQRLNHMHVDNSRVKRPLDLINSQYASRRRRLQNGRTWKCIRRCSRPNRSFSTLVLHSLVSNRFHNTCPRQKTYAMGRLRAHRLLVFSPYALICLRSPRSFVHRGSSLMRSTAFSNCHVPLFGEKTSWYRSVKTPPYSPYS